MGLWREGKEVGSWSGKEEGVGGKSALPVLSVILYILHPPDPSGIRLQTQ